MKISLPGGHLLPPFSVGYVKGWKRCVVLLIVLQSIRELNLQDEIAHEIKATFGTIHCSFAKTNDVRAKVEASRGATMVQSATRKAPNCFQPYVAQIENAARADALAKEESYAQEVRKADLQVLLRKLDNDLDILSKRSGTEQQKAIECAKDMKYLKDRQGKGHKFVDQFLEQNCCLIRTSNDFHNAIGDLLKFKEQFRGISGKEYVICSLDCTVWPADSAYVSNALATLSSVLALSASHVGFVQMPVLQSQTSRSALLKHKHLLENSLYKHSLTTHHTVQILYTKPPEATSRDQRGLSQLALAVFHEHFEGSSFASESRAVREGKLGPNPLIPYSQFMGYDNDTVKPGASARVEQKGLPCHISMIMGLLDGLNVQNGDRVVFVDVIPNRFAEFGRALVESRLKDERIFLRYVGFLLEEQCNENIAAIRDMVYRHWDNSQDAPPKKRVSDNQVAEAPSLQILAWQDGPLWPDILLSRFPEGTCEAAEMLKQKEKFDVLYPPSSRPARPQSRDRAHRAGGCCDFSVDSEAKPIDLSRTLTLTFVEEADFSESRLGNALPTKNKPAVLISTSMCLWIGNTTDNPMAVEAGELCGFGTGSFEKKVISDPKLEKNALPFRLQSDLTLVSYQKAAMPLCEMLRTLASEDGIAQIDLEDHELASRVHPAEDGADPIPISFRYELKPKSTKTANVFKPNSPSVPASKEIRSSMLGACFAGSYEKLLQQSQSKFALVWEVAFSSSPPRIQVEKPKVHLLGKVHLPAHSWANLSA
ncbi:unnamed protein product [Durusdinium trenchii]|uniref:Uncharacterized protein n=1 Tax=Durusdinium trenchii TaxID=1381693 RepID=A0ABP0MJJ4_9DINO